MENKEIHAGHRERTLNKLFNYSDSFLDHELLEILLFPLLPRIDTNSIAHELLRTFKSLDKIFSARVEDLMTVKGIGKKTASYLVCLGKIYQRAFDGKTKNNDCVYASFDKYKNIITDYFKNDDTEKIVLFLLDKNYRKLYDTDFSFNSGDNAKADVHDIVKLFAVYKPEFVIMSHNHPSGIIEPSDTDDFTTKKFNILCSMHGVKLIDHVIVCKNNSYSYFIEGKMDKIKRETELSNIINQLK